MRTEERVVKFLTKATKENHTKVFHSIRNAHAVSSLPGGRDARSWGLPNPGTEVSQTNSTTEDARMSPGWPPGVALHREPSDITNRGLESKMLRDVLNFLQMSSIRKQ